MTHTPSAIIVTVHVENGRHPFDKDYYLDGATPEAHARAGLLIARDMLDRGCLAGREPPQDPGLTLAQAQALNGSLREAAITAVNAYTHQAKLYAREREIEGWIRTALGMASSDDAWVAIHHAMEDLDLTGYRVRVRSYMSYLPR